MIIKRVIHGEEVEIVLTTDEIADAHREFVVDWMTCVLEDDFDIPATKAREWGYLAYDNYCNGDGLTEYEAVELTAEEYREDLNPGQDEDIEKEDE